MTDRSYPKLDFWRHGIINQKMDLRQVEHVFFFAFLPNLWHTYLMVFQNFAAPLTPLKNHQICQKFGKNEAKLCSTLTLKTHFSILHGTSKTLNPGFGHPISPVTSKLFLNSAFTDFWPKKVRGQSTGRTGQNNLCYCR